MASEFIVVSKTKKFIKEQTSGGFSNFNTSQEAINVLSDYVKGILLEAIESAKNDGRKTVMARDIEGIMLKRKSNG